MRYYLPLLLLLMGATTLFGQKSDCTDCDHRCLCIKNFGGYYTNSQKAVLKKNWTDYLGADLESELPLLDDKNQKVDNVFSIKLDGLGCIYPDFVLDDQLAYDFVNDRQKLTWIPKYCFYMLVFRKLDSLIFKYPEHSALFKELFDITNRNAGDGDQFFRLFDFKEKWNNYFLPKLMTKLEKIIAEKNIQKMVYFVQGFNVPYALAQVQGNAVFADVIRNMNNQKKSYKEVLFVRLFWPSHSSKYSDFNEQTCNVDNIENLPTGKLYKFVTNRVYLGSLTIREFIAGINKRISHHFISHSFGAALTTGVVLHPEAKIRKTTTYFNSRLLNKYQTQHIPIDRKVSLFLSAPGIPGKTSFAYLNKDTNSNHRFFISYNDDDEILRKAKFNFLGINAGRRNATSLGCNWKGEIDSVKSLARERNLSDNFKFCRTSENENHDYFCYREQENFQKFFTKYVYENIIKDL